MAQGFEQTVLAHRLEAGVRGEDYIPTGVAGQHLSQHLFIAFIGRERTFTPNSASKLEMVSGAT